MGYALADDDDDAASLSDSESQSTTSKHPGSKTSRWKVLRLSLALLLAAALGAVAMTAIERLTLQGSSSSSISLKTRKSLGNCGTTPTTAQQWGCIFDVMSFTWNLPACHNAVLSDDFRRIYGYKYYLDEAGAQEVPYSDVALGERDLWSSWEQHLIHCLYTARKFHHAHDHRLPIDGYVGSYNHTTHCGMQWMEQLYTPIDVKAINTLIEVKYPECWEP